MENVIAEIYSRIEHIEKRPLMFCSSADFSSVSNYLFGFFEGIQFCNGIDINGQFTDYLNKKAVKTSLIWWGYIWHILAKEDDQIASKILFEELKGFLNILKIG